MKSYKKLTITIPTWIYNKYLKEVTENRSAFIVEMFVGGITKELGENETNANKQIELINKIREKDEEISKIKLQLLNLQSKIDRKKLKEKTYVDPETGKMYEKQEDGSVVESK